ncbi:MAG TPA: sensor histidine kinase, partial [Acidovorax sp.]|nr:sensor histidine kinase [Acidovorax sp.]
MRRTLLALLAAMALVWLVLLGQAALDHYRAMDENPGVHQLARGLAGALAGLDQPAQAQALVQGMAYTLNSLRKDVDLLRGTKVLLQLQDRAGQLLHSSTTGLAAVVTAGDSGHVQAEVAGVPHWVAWESAGPWRVVAAEPRLSDARLLGFMGEDLAASVLLALPLVG